MRADWWTSPRARLIALAVLLAAIVVVPYGRSGPQSRSCGNSDCRSDGQVRWTRELPGTWLAESGGQGTVAAAGQPYVAVGDRVAAIGFGLRVDAFDEQTGAPLWSETLSDLPDGSRVVSIRTWPGVVTASVQEPAANRWEDIVFDAATGRRLRVFGSVAYGGAVSAGARRTVIVKATTVTCYANATGKMLWRDRIGPAGQAWRVADGYLYVTVSARGQIGTAPITAVRQIRLSTGSERLIQPPSGSFDGALAGVAFGDLLFSSASGLSIYGVGNGRLVARMPGAVPEGIDPVRRVLYVEAAGVLAGLDPATGGTEPHTRVPGPPGTYGVRAGVALGVDHGSSGDIWGYSIAKRHVVWTTRTLPWPHYFVDPSGIGGSADPAGGTVLITSCASMGAQARTAALTPGTAVRCRRPMLVAISR